MRTRLFVALLVLAASACGARDGLSDKDYGKILFWEVIDVELVWTECTDADFLRSSIVAPDFEENSFIIYLVSDDGSRLIDQDCTAVDGATCKDGEFDIVFQEAGGEYHYDPPQASGGEVSPGCSLTIDPLWVLEDEGQQLFLSAGTNFGLQPEVDGACMGVDDNIKASGSNEFGVVGCRASFEVVADYFARDKP